MDQLDYLPISMLNQLEYCERRFWYMFVQGEMEVNAPVLEGTYQHERAHAAGTEHAGEDVTHRRVYVYSQRLRLVGFVDLVEETGGVVYPVEYKRGKMGRWLNDHIQLCAQAMCLEERLEKTIEQGYIFYFGSRRRVAVQFTPELRERTLAAIDRAFELLAQGRIPAPIDNYKKCRDCSLEPICLPKEVRQLVR
jgi:CRISPR-associated exonuclease Cas4